MKCKACAAQLEDAMRFCPNCGETAHPHRLDLKHIFHEFIHAFVHADKGIFLLIKQLVLQPGHTAFDYVNGAAKNISIPLASCYWQVA